MFKFKFADIAEGLESGKVIEVFVKEGDKIEDGDDLFSVETEKVNTEIGSPVDGIISKIYISPGEEIMVGQVVIDIDDGSADSAEETAAVLEEPKEVEVKEQGASVVGAVPISNDVIPSRSLASNSAATPVNNNVKATPIVRKMAEQKNINLNQVTGTGPGGRIIKSDLDNYQLNTSSTVSSTEEFINTSIKATPIVRRLAKAKNINLQYIMGTGPGGRILKSDLDNYQPTASPAPAPAPAVQPPAAVPPVPAASVAVPPPAPLPSFMAAVPSEPYTYQKLVGIRKAIARQMSLSKRTIPETTLMIDVELTELINLRAQLKEEAASQGVKLTFMAFFVKACTASLKKYPVLNTSLDDEKDTIIFKNFYNIGIAVDSPSGLMVPVIQDADQKSILRVAAEIVDLAIKVRNRTIQLSEMKNGTFTISNYGSVGIEYGTPVINYPEAAILGIGAIVKKPVVTPEGTLAVGNVLPLSLTIDHRIIDGADAGRFLQVLKNLLESPAKLLL